MTRGRPGGMMQQIRIAIEARDPATIAELDNEIKDLRGHEPAGAELIEGPTPRTTVAGDLLTTVLVALASGVAVGAGKQVGETVINWLVERIRALTKRRKTVVILSVGDVSLTVDEHTVPAKAAAQLAAGLR